MQSCILNSSLTEAPLIEEKDQKEFSIGFSGPIPRIYSSYAYGLTDKFAIQSQASVSFISFDIQQSIGYYKKMNEKVTWELYVDYLYGNGATFNLGGYSGAAGNYHVPSLRYNIGMQIKKRILIGISIKTGYFYSKYDHWRDEYSAELDSLGTYPFEFVRYYDEKAHALYFAPSIFFKFNMPRMQIGINTQVQTLYHFQSQNIALLPFSIGLSYQHKKTNKTEVQEFKDSKRALYESKHNVSIRFSPAFNNYPKNYISNPYYNKSLWRSVPLHLGYERHFNYWFSIHSSIYYFSKKGVCKYIDHNDIHKKVDYILHDFKYKFEPRVHYYFSEKIDVYSSFNIFLGFSYGMLKKADILSNGTEVNQDDVRVEFSNWPFAFCPLGIKYYFYKNYGCSIDYIFHNGGDPRNFYFGIHKKF